MAAAALRKDRRLIFIAYQHLTRRFGSSRARVTKVRRWAIVVGDADLHGARSVVYLDGDPGDFIHPGAELIHVTAWQVLGPGAPETFWYEANLSGAEWWMFAFSAKDLGRPLEVDRYDHATRYPFEATGDPGVDVGGSGRGCNVSSGWFAIESIAAGPTAGTYSELTATFEQHCENGAAALRGCIHFEN